MEVLRESAIKSDWTFNQLFCLLSALETYFTYMLHIYFRANIFHKFQDHKNNLNYLNWR